MGFGGIAAILLISLTAGASELQDLLRTREPTIVAEDGKLRFARAYDAGGRLIRLEITDELQSPSLRQVIDIRENGRTLEKLTWLDGHAHERAIESYYSPGRLRTRTVERPMERPTSRIVWTFTATREKRVEYRLEGARAIELSSSEEDSVLAGPGESEVWSQYLDCQVRAGRLTERTAGACETVLWGRFQDFLGQLRSDLNSLIPMPCEDERQVFAASGFRIDRTSCDLDASKRSGPDDPIRVLSAATSLVTGPMLSCLRDLNPSYAAELAAQMPDARWHLIGRLQSNKAAVAVRTFSLLHGIDSLSTSTAVASSRNATSISTSCFLTTL